MRYFKFLSATIAFAWTISATAQQDAMYSQYTFNMLSVNPAYACTKGAMNVLLLQRLQWIGFDGAPRTNTLTVQSPLFFKNLGIGGTLVSDKIGPLNTYYLTLDVASKIKIHQGGYLALGLKAGFDIRKANLTQLSPLDKADASYYTDAVSKIRPNIGTGIFYYTDNYYLGISTPKFIKSKLEDESGTISEETERHFFFIGGYIHEYDENLKIKPSFIIKAVKGAPASVDLTCSVMFKERVSAGGAYRFGDSFGLQAQVRIIQQLWIGYAYDITVSKMARFNSGTHEIMVFLDTELLKKGIIKSPRFF